MHVANLFFKSFYIFVTHLFALTAFLDVLVVCVLLRVVLLLQFGNFVLENFLMFSDIIDLILWSIEFEFHELLEFAHGLHVRSKFAGIHLVSLEFLIGLLVSEENAGDFGCGCMQFDHGLALFIGCVLVIDRDHFYAIFQAIVREFLFKTRMVVEAFSNLWTEMVNDLLFTLAQLGEELLVEE